MSADFWSLVAVVSFWGWVATFLTFIFKAFPSFSVFRVRQAVIWGGASFLSACLWMTALRYA